MTLEIISWIIMNYLYAIPLLGMIVLIYSAVQDVRFRKINILPIILLSLLSVVVASISYWQDKLHLLAYFQQIILSFILVAVLYILGRITSYLYIGEGDLYVLMMISFSNVVFLSFSFVLFVFLLSLLITAVIPFVQLFYNLVSGNWPCYKFPQNIVLMFLGVPMYVSKITDKYTPLERFSIVKGRLIRHINLSPNTEPDREIKNLIEIANKKALKKIWVSPLHPLIVSILIAYIVLVVFAI